MGDVVTLKTDRRHRNGHILELGGGTWRCIHCRHWFDAAVDADLFWCGDDCTGKHPHDSAPDDGTGEVTS